MSFPNWQGTQWGQSNSKASFLNLLYLTAVHTNANQYVDVTADCSDTCDKGFEEENVSEIKYSILRLSVVSRGWMASNPAFRGPCKSSGELLIE